MTAWVLECRRSDFPAGYRFLWRRYTVFAEYKASLLESVDFEFARRLSYPVGRLLAGVSGASWFALKDRLPCRSALVSYLAMLLVP